MLSRRCAATADRVRQMKIRTYSELIQLPTFEERYRYLRLRGSVGEETFGFDRVFNQRFYSSPEWKRLRREIIIRDNGCDLGIADREICGNIFIHHINPIMLRDIETSSEFLLNPEYLICTSFETHNAIHYGDENLLVTAPIERSMHDTCPWK